MTNTDGTPIKIERACLAAEGPMVCTTRRWREADSNCESLSEIVPLAPGQMIGKSRADGGKILEQLGSRDGILSASIGMPMVASQR
jgi:hypothetical protein